LHVSTHVSPRILAVAPDVVLPLNSLSSTLVYGLKLKFYELHEMLAFYICLTFYYGGVFIWAVFL